MPRLNPHLIAALGIGVDGPTDAELLSRFVTDEIQVHLSSLFGDTLHSFCESVEVSCGIGTRPRMLPKLRSSPRFVMGRATSYLAWRALPITTQRRNIQADVNRRPTARPNAM